MFTQCKKKNAEIKESKKTIKIFAENIYDLGMEMKFEMYSDSSYNFTTFLKSPNYERTEKFNGFCYLKNDTLIFKPFEFEYSDSEKAVIKNNFIEFISAEKNFRIEIKKNNFAIKSKLDFTKFKDYAVFTYIAENEKSERKAYDLIQEDLESIDKIINKCFVENKTKLKDKNEYVFQCVAFINEKNEKEIKVNFYCKNEYDKSGFKYNLIEMNDGGNCNISLKINLTKNIYTDLHIAGLA